MILETGKIVSIEPEGVWVETIQRSVCGTCKAEKGCGQSLMAKWGANPSYLWVLLEGRDPAHYRIGDDIQIGIPEDVVVKASLLAYVMPLLLIVLGAVGGQVLFASDLASGLGALGGLVLGGLFLRWHAVRSRYDSRLQPVLVDERKPLHFYQPASPHQ
ncbi:SoxR reducing system RseC family protein [Cellvibrio japonicus]|uniref:Positive regulator for alginate biosynthesis MucC n=1 Tax=Cellvibrio japonicus (strain Ueda107) TaxID=498211 RepID=B3PJ98_CELJU|nr:SoxR reducing system RseC family protein [Cellvibrio japonicus]ACE84498.1 positive regulator for alginate biosynthesis MucC [Cellvibrio japonicus Ueda107]QEI12650.1 SoxR reducing system RseC family protein [Cellvibrio japonicus]QEI16224.1 SoxR reducing system RseC family protein [Cellvibrio japonicus]QEI19802.1 SoxR reducing system RseC family protein [Cellvibrio japonicus]